MADLSAIQKTLQAQYDNIYKPQIYASDRGYQDQINAQNQNYQTQLNNLTGTYNNTLGQENQKLAAIPGQWQPRREAANLSLQQANNSMNDQLANLGYSPDSGLAYDTRIANNANFGKLVDTANAGQNSATQGENNTINTLGVNFNNSKNNLATTNASTVAGLRTKQSAAHSNLVTQEQTAIQNAIARQQAAEAAAALKQQEFQQQLGLAQYKAGLSADNQSARISQQQATEQAKEQKAAQTAAANAHAQHAKGVKQVYNALSNIGNNGTSAAMINGKLTSVYTPVAKQQMKKTLADYYNRGDYLTDDDVKQIVQHYGL